MKIRSEWKSAAYAAVVLTVISWLVIRAGIAIGQTWVEPGEGLKNAPDLFRFDSEYYYAIATDGYAYNGTPYSSPNIVFAPAFPIATWVLTFTGLEAMTAGFILNKVFLLFGFFFLYLYLSGEFGARRTFAILLAMGTTAGSYSLHAFYSEAMMLFLLSLTLYSVKSKNWPLAALATAILGATRVAALPMVVVMSGFLGWRAWKTRAIPPLSRLLLACAVICPAGLAAYLGYIGINFGNPFVLFPEIQSASWAFFHPKVSPFFLLGPNLVQFAATAAQKGLATFYDIMTINLCWTLLALFAAIHMLRSRGWTVFTTLFVSYFAFTYFTGAGSEYLISAHRFYLLMIPIFLMFNDLHSTIARRASRWAANSITGLLFFVNLIYCLLHTAFFNQGVWFFF